MSHDHDPVSARVSARYTHRSILDHHIHNSTSLGNDLELYYYSSPQGQLEIKRRIDSAHRVHEAHQRIHDIVTDPHADLSNLVDFTDEERAHVESSIRTGRRMMKKENSTPGDDRPHREEILHALADYSQAWLSGLSTIQQETISHLTSNGFIYLQGAIAGDDNEIFDHPVFNQLITDEVYFALDHDADVDEEIISIKRAMAEEFARVLSNAFEQVPIVDEQITTYRGTSMDEVRDLIGDLDISDRELLSELIEGRWDGTPISDSSRLAQIPVSSSVLVDVAHRFGYGVILEIIRGSVTSPVNVSAWGPWEGDVLTRPASTHTIDGAYLSTNNGENTLVVQITETVG